MTLPVVAVVWFSIKIVVKSGHQCTLLVVALVIIPVGTATGPGDSGVGLVVDPEMITLSAVCNSCLVFHQDHHQPRSRVATNAHCCLWFWLKYLWEPQ